jgi:hypothetical protein
MQGRDDGQVVNSLPPLSSAPAGYRFPREVIAVAVRWYLRYGLSYRDVAGSRPSPRVHSGFVLDIPIQRSSSREDQLGHSERYPPEKIERCRNVADSCATTRPLTARTSMNPDGVSGGSETVTQEENIAADNERDHYDEQDHDRSVLDTMLTYPLGITCGLPASRQWNCRGSR